MLSEKAKSFLPQIIDYFKNEPIVRGWLFGSFSRNEETGSSDIDILVDHDKSKPISLLKICGMMIDLEELTGRKVDLVGAIDPYQVGNRSIAEGNCPCPVGF